jgi:hypothetical protein
MSSERELLPRASMTDAQRACFDLLCEAFYGEHHVPDNIYAFGRGIKCNVQSHMLATFDFDCLTRLVVLAHDRCVRLEIVSSGPGRIGLVLHKRASREGAMHERHPTIEDAVQRVRGGRA